MRLPGVLLAVVLAAGCSSPSATSVTTPPEAPPSVALETPGPPPADSPLCDDLRTVAQQQASAPPGVPVPRTVADAASRVLAQAAGASEGVLPDDVAQGLREVARLRPVDPGRAAALARFVREQCPA